MNLRRKCNGAKHSTEATGYRRQSTEDRWSSHLKIWRCFSGPTRSLWKFIKRVLNFPGESNTVWLIRYEERANRSAQTSRKVTASNTIPRLNLNAIWWWRLVQVMKWESGFDTASIYLWYLRINGVHGEMNTMKSQKCSKECTEVGNSFYHAR